jgi:catechol 2,3-dioxygenase-like lactoylglutathione lyase family enzyme/GNAT superfamily N-acetyltransferase
VPSAGAVTVRPLAEPDLPWAAEVLERLWGLPVVTPTGPQDPTTLPGVVGEIDGRRAGLVTYRIAGGDCEIVTVHADVEGAGVAVAMLAAVRAIAERAGCRRAWLVTTNDNTRALGFYQAQGMDLVALHRDFVEVVRRYKPASGGYRHALELEWRLMEDDGAVVRGISHVTLSVPDVDAALGFYAGVLGCGVLARWPRGAYLLAGDTWLALVHGPAPGPGADDYSHVAFDVDRSAFGALAARVRASGAPIWQENWTEGESLYFLDPAGHRLELHCTSLVDRLRAARAEPWDGLELTDEVSRLLAPGEGRSR